MSEPKDNEGLENVSLLGFLDSAKKKPNKKARLDTLIEMVKLWGGFPKLNNPETNMLDWEQVSKLIWLIAKEEKADITIEEVQQSLTLDTVNDALRIATAKLTVKLPQEVMDRIREQTGQLEEKPELKIALTPEAITPAEEEEKKNKSSNSNA